MSLVDFRMRFARDRWTEERASWRAVILLNLVRSANTILDALSQEMDDVEQDGLDGAFKFDDYYRQYKVRLSPLQAVESNLKRLLGATEDIQPRKQISPTTIIPNGSQEFFVRSRSWRNFLQTTQGPDSESPRRFQQDLPTLLDSTDVIANGKDDIKTLWRDSHIQAMLWKRKTRLEDSAGLSAYSYSSVAFFL
jgi:hypothetical protein